MMADFVQIKRVQEWFSEVCEIRRQRMTESYFYNRDPYVVFLWPNWMYLED